MLRLARQRRHRQGRPSGHPRARIPRPCSPSGSGSRSRRVSTRASPKPHSRPTTLRSPRRARSRARRRLLRDQPRPLLRRCRRAFRQSSQRLLAASPCGRASRRSSSTRPEQFDLLPLGIGVTNAAYRTTPGSGDLRAGDFAGSAERLERLAASCGPARSPSSARRPTAAPSASAPSMAFRSGARRDRRSSCSRRPRRRTRPFPGTSGCAGSRRCGSSSDPTAMSELRIRPAARAVVLDPDDRILLVRFEFPGGWSGRRRAVGSSRARRPRTRSGASSPRRRAHRGRHRARASGRGSTSSRSSAASGTASGSSTTSSARRLRHRSRASRGSN